MIRASGWLGKRSQICFQLKESSTSLSQKHTLCFWRVQRYLKREVNPFWHAGHFQVSVRNHACDRLEAFTLKTIIARKNLNTFTLALALEWFWARLRLYVAKVQHVWLKIWDVGAAAKIHFWRRWPLLWWIAAIFHSRLSLSIYCPQYQYREMCKSDIWSYYAFPFTWRKSGYNRSSVTNMNKNLNHCTRCICCSGEWV